MYRREYEEYCNLAEESQGPHYIFVYGTLKRHGGNDSLLRNSEYLGEAWTEEEFVFCGQGYPRAFKPKKEEMDVLKVATAQVYGEVYKVGTETLKDMDGLEGHPHFYRREPTSIKGEAADKVPNDKPIEMYHYQRRDGRVLPSVVLRPVVMEDGFVRHFWPVGG